ncbi:hypothetical protein QYF36_025069 [Acer negundo]|nr:hypothetical protein QYF36_025069 [Acer negundo]
MGLDGSRVSISIRQLLLVSLLKNGKILITKSPFEANILRILYSEIDYQSDYVPPHQPAVKFNSFAVEDGQGEQWMTMNGKFDDSEDIDQSLISSCLFLESSC